MSPQFAIRATGMGDETVLAIVGELDSGTAPELRDVLRNETTTRRLVVLDLTKTVLMDSTAMAVLVGAIADAKATGGDLRVRARMHSNVRRVLELSGVLSALPLVD